MRYTLPEGKKLIELARQALTSNFTDEEIPHELLVLFTQPQGVYVTLYKKDVAIARDGIPYPLYPLSRAVIRGAKQAAFETSTPLRQEEIAEIDIELHLLREPTFLRKADFLEYPSRIHIGFDGIMLRAGTAHSIILPDEAEEQKGNSEQLLKIACLRAGLDPSAWQTPDVTIATFQTQVFRERNGKVEEKE